VEDRGSAFAPHVVRLPAFRLGVRARGEGPRYHRRRDPSPHRPAGCGRPRIDARTRSRAARAPPRRRPKGAL